MGDPVAHFLCKVRTAVTHGMGKSSLGPGIWGQWYRVDKDKRTEQVMRDEVAKLGLQTELESQDSTIDIHELRENMLRRSRSTCADKASGRLCQGLASGLLVGSRGPCLQQLLPANVSAISILVLVSCYKLHVTCACNIINVDGEAALVELTNGQEGEGQ